VLAPSGGQLELGFGFFPYFALLAVYART